MHYVWRMASAAVIWPAVGRQKMSILKPGMLGVGKGGKLDGVL